MSQLDGTPDVTIVSGNPIEGGRSLIVHVKLWQYSVDANRYVADSDSVVDSFLVSNQAHRKPAYRTLVASVTNPRMSGKRTLVIPGVLLVPRMLPLLFSEEPPWLVLVQGDVGRWTIPLTWSGK